MRYHLKWECSSKRLGFKERMCGEYRIRCDSCLVNCTNLWACGLGLLGDLLALHLEPSRIPCSYSHAYVVATLTRADLLAIRDLSWAHAGCLVLPLGGHLLQMP
jgi:hypothetical protein